MRYFLVVFMALYIVTIAFLMGLSQPESVEASVSSPSYHEQLSQVIDILLRIERKLK